MTLDVLFCNISQMILKKLNLFKNFLKLVNELILALSFPFSAFSFLNKLLRKESSASSRVVIKFRSDSSSFEHDVSNLHSCLDFFCHVNSKMFSVPAARIEMQTLPVRTSSCKSSIPSTALAAITFIWLFCKSMYFSFGLNWNKFGSNWVRLPLSK